MKWIFLLLAVIGEIFATAALKESDGFTKLWPAVTTVAGYAFTFYFFSLALREIDISVAYAIWAGVGIILLTVIGYVRFGQRLDTPAFFGIGLITAGVIIINLFSQSAHPE